ncbi:group III truncated hemoglobin [Roseiarcaceae bacterium H3SJ34-1]|nr:group III truncated hemoglobin [Roseiarcaceae bacterium H3SJ34-1]
MKGRPAPTRAMTIDGKLIPDELDEAMIHAVVHGFYDKIRNDELLGPIFNGAIAAEAWPRHLAKMCDFWSATLLRTGRYEGHPLRPHLALPGIGEAHFRRWLSLFRSTVRELCPPDAAALFLDRAMRIAHSFRLAIAFHNGENAVAMQPILEENLEGSTGAS